MGEPISAEALDLVQRGGRWRFEARPDGQAMVSSLIGLLQTALDRLGATAPAAGASVHAAVLGLLTAAGAAGAAGGAYPNLRAKCREYADYLSAKLAEHRLPPLPQLGDGLPEKLSPDARVTVLTVTREILGHLANHVREEPGFAVAMPAAAEHGPPLRFRPSEDDSRKARRYMYVGDETAIVEMHADFSLFLGLRDLSLVPTLLQTGWWEPWIDQILRSLLSPGMSYVNAGANVGYHACLGAKLVEDTGRVFAFEANPNVFKLLRRSVFYNGFSNRMRLSDAAVAGEGGRRTFYFLREQSGSGELFEPPALQREPGTGPWSETFQYSPGDYEMAEVPCVTLDETVGREVEGLDLLQMDIEGSEGPAILGARNLIARSRDLRLLAEWSIGRRDDAALRDSYREAASFLDGQGFRFYRIVPPAGNVFSTPPDLRRVEVGDLLGLPHADLFAVRG